MMRSNKSIHPPRVVTKSLPEADLPHIKGVDYLAKQLLDAFVIAIQMTYPSLISTVLEYRTKIIKMLSSKESPPQQQRIIQAVALMQELTRYMDEAEGKLNPNKDKGEVVAPTVEPETGTGGSASMSDRFKQASDPRSRRARQLLGREVGNIQQYRYHGVPGKWVHNIETLTELIFQALERVMTNFPEMQLYTRQMRSAVYLELTDYSSDQGIAVRRACVMAEHYMDQAQRWLSNTMTGLQNPQTLLEPVTTVEAKPKTDVTA